MPKPTKPNTKSLSQDEMRAQRHSAALRESLKYNAPPADDEDDPVPEDLDVFRLALARRIRAMLGTPDRCRERVCRRSKRCAGPDMRCARDFPSPQLSAEERARLRAKLHNALKRRLAELALGPELRAGMR
jgi:hypothetical protein